MHPSFTFHVLRLDPLMISHPPTQFPGSATAYGYNSRDVLPVDLDINPPLDGVTAVITEVNRITNTLFNITSIFSVNDVAVLNGSSLQCGDSKNASHPLNISTSKYASTPLMGFSTG